MAATLYLIGAILILLVGMSTWYQVRNLGPATPVYFFTGWVAGDAVDPSPGGLFAYVVTAVNGVTPCFLESCLSRSVCSSMKRR